MVLKKSSISRMLECLRSFTLARGLMRNAGAGVPHAGRRRSKNRCTGGLADRLARARGDAHAVRDLSAWRDMLRSSRNTRASYVSARELWPDHRGYPSHTAAAAAPPPPVAGMAALVPALLPDAAPASVAIVATKRRSRGPGSVQWGWWELAHQRGLVVMYPRLGGIVVSSSAGDCLVSVQTRALRKQHLQR